MTRYPESKIALQSWLGEVESAEWDSPQIIKEQYKNASVLSGKRVIFNISGNKYRLIVDIEFRLKIVFVVWFGSHKQYDKIDAKLIRYVKTYKK